ncbi:MAG: hypothetical protein ACI8RZ_006799 [Myxococcota bacterium]|jgi:hypothetical protein
METTAVVTAYEAALPDDPEIERKLMFGTPCAFVNRQMFFGTFENTIVARIGPERVSALSEQPGMQVFTLSETKVWDDYLQLDATTDAALLTELAAEAFAWASALPRKIKAPLKTRRERRKNRDS